MVLSVMNILQTENYIIDVKYILGKYTLNPHFVAISRGQIVVILPIFLRITSRAQRQSHDSLSPGESIDNMNPLVIHDVTTRNNSTTKPCAYFTEHITHETNPDCDSLQWVFTAL